jgi:hypothetical protein
MAVILFFLVFYAVDGSQSISPFHDCKNNLIVCLNN